MDPVSQGLVGSVLPASASNKNEIRLAVLIGFLAGLLADIDVIIRSSTDPLLFIEYHRQFTHSLIFIPIGGLVASGICWLFLRKRLRFRRIYFYAVLGYGTHCLLDAGTNYGTELLWPFSDAKIAWNIISIIDPIFTITLLLLVILALILKSRMIARIGLVFAVLYLLFGFYQKESAKTALLELAETRGHKVERVMVHPSIGNLILWRAIYESDGTYYVQAIRVSPLSETKIYNGNSIEAFNASNDLHEVDPNSVLYNDFKRFKHFARDFLVIHPDYPDIIGDLRMGMLPNSTLPIWGIKFDPANQNEHVSMENYDRSLDDGKIRRFKSMILGQDLDDHE